MHTKKLKATINDKIGNSNNMKIASAAHALAAWFAEIGAT